MNIFIYILVLYTVVAKQMCLQAAGVKGNAQSSLLWYGGDHFVEETMAPQRLPLTVFVPLDGHKGIVLPDPP